jgi:phospholipid/cholesterol/gamma-HCH transport system substrate-binding protein
VISRRIIANLVVFLGLSIALVTYGLVTLFGNPFQDRATIVADLPSAGGLRTGFSASHDGVIIGTVDKIELLKGKVRVTVALDPGVEVPNSVEAKVVRASAVGEQRLDLVSTGKRSTGNLADGAHVPLADDPVPPDVADVLATTTKLFEALPADDLNTLVHEAAVGIDGRAADLKSINRSLLAISDDVVALDPDLRKLLADGPPVLDDFSAMSPEVHQALGNTQALTRILADTDQDLVRLLGNGADLAEVADRVVLDNRANLTCLTKDLRTLNHTLQGDTLKNFSRALEINTLFFGIIDKVAVRGESADVGYGPAQNDVLWLRSRLLVPPGSPEASNYVPPRAPRPVTTGKACSNGYGKGTEAGTPPARSPYAPRNRMPATGSGTRSTQAPPDVRSIVPAGQATPRPAANQDLIPLLVLGVGILAALASIVPTRRHRRRAP